MRELTFFTTNSTKLAHARYLAEGHHIRIQGFRQRTYHADYVEPRLATREAILEASYRSAKAQILKAGFSEATHPFILEDTSVRIDALSREGVEVPGVDIKYWMEDRSFEDLDRTLVATGGARSASVRSDILLYVPTNFRKSWGVDAEYIIFTGVQHGHIVQHEHSYRTNLVYPWLDNKSFNKWFQPDGCDAPLGALPIGVADTVDFRRKSFNSLFSFLEQRNYMTRYSSQMELSLDKKPNIILSGYTCSGKTTASQYLSRSFGYLHVEASDFMHLSYYYRHGYRGPLSIGDFAENALAQKPTIAAEKVVEYILDNLPYPVVISGFRAQPEVVFLEQEMASRGKHFLKLFVDADEQVRFERLRARARPGDNLSIDEFRARDAQQLRMGLENIRQSAEVLSIDNNASLRSYFDRINLLVGGENEDKIDIDSSLTAVSKISEVGLADAILVALLSVWKDDESRRFYTTTEMAKLLLLTFPSISPKHKDNISRYFNQDYYAYYEISTDSGRRTKKYRLSNTGYGLAIRTLRSMLRRKNNS
ncbi:non-canonical purine NTP pyrophosphatase [Mesorhizobium sp.]|jgi:dephospho-CoA kinase/inosine/xanthosine triphosphate pyrophosphatase family protein|uniref:non-canonical purine NTP pyrophosphatase n=1 Tax=Mesorhizobium sp. TaxID=1871066 RepID=UPI003563158B